ncbi:MULTISPECIES: glutamate-5-semialdehyde dehydrogenase [Aerococcus]|uniref:Gamma-glutamyl phosphate reductase n=1 Tax=Aerococcus sanguinicola TaxID=119206 RepID=A0A5N1GHR7_9LACT|nr:MULTISPECIES: glutamate-5-semialdehyde dehydrogenase [Aerococcus]KAA9300495.1 glutamate-5-semialdehyde dehydrogenase [Aerococcus sanguinicola]MDK6369690.1 glutamate-5-semialdehyde dehydrogenase [Aerococcus sp. UMB9870]MDK6680330.1 glutamate-5-semialdehyde dehydrogenase [Aerococcus sp. UMB8608]MDK6686909.1 glutamate-5-semialdehyde dehydrogenase [Aerococcus sp. UMB8623]MDK6940021.1 glutamate-5-semialdehyde dehydrogenase [Aerococcus sp. UMB8487]
MDIKELGQLCEQAKAASRHLAQAHSQTKEKALFAMADQIRQAQASILEANAQDIAQTRDQGRPDSFIERMTLTEDRIEAMALGLEDVARQPDPINEVITGWTSPQGLNIVQKRVPLGVIGIIYESRPNVTADAAGLCFKAGNSAILRGGKETLQTNRAIVTALQAGLADADLPQAAIQYIDDPNRALATAFMQMDRYVDCLIPRGSGNLIQSVVQNATIPTIETGVGNCHLYVHQSADLDQAVQLFINGKAQRVSVCNALETLVLDQAIAKDFLDKARPEIDRNGIRLHGDQRTCALVKDASPAEELDYAEEYLDYDIAVKIVDSYQEAIDHIQTYSSQHSEVIATEDYRVAQDFMNDIDAACVYVNASSRFSDGGIFGFGGEIGISTQKLHARGPMGLEALTSYKYLIQGQGQIRE